MRALSRCRRSLAVTLLFGMVWSFGPPTAPDLQAAPQGSRRAFADPRNLAVGKLLVARRGLGDGNFSETVVLLFAYTPRDGAAGLIINRKSKVPTRTVLPDLPAPSRQEQFIFEGGPVAPDQVRGLLRVPLPGTNFLRVLPDVGVVTSSSALEDAVADGATADRLRLYGGYAGWSPGQLEREIQRGDWYITAGDSKVIFAVDPERVWRQQIQLVDVLAV